MMKLIRNVVTETKESKNLGTETLEEGTIELKICKLEPRKWSYGTGTLGTETIDPGTY